jgi:hypothetical protein
MPEDDWDARLFVERMRSGAFDGRITKTLDALRPDQLHEVNKVLAEDGDIGANVPGDPKWKG